MTDLAVHRLAARLLGPRSAAWALAAVAASWFIAYAGPRTLSNSLEMAALTLAASYWPGLGGAGGRGGERPRLALAWGAVAVLLRPTAGVVLAPL